MGSSGFLNGVLGTGATQSTDLDLAFITIESEAIAALAVRAHNLRTQSDHAFFGTRSKVATTLSV